MLCYSKKIRDGRYNKKINRDKSQRCRLSLFLWEVVNANIFLTFSSQNGSLPTALVRKRPGTSRTIRVKRNKSVPAAWGKTIFSFLHLNGE